MVPVGAVAAARADGRCERHHLADTIRVRSRGQRGCGGCLVDLLRHRPRTGGESGITGVDDSDRLRPCALSVAVLNVALPPLRVPVPSTVAPLLKVIVRHLVVAPGSN
jgi:hypothetical protein